MEQSMIKTPTDEPEVVYVRVDALHGADINPKRHKMEDLKASLLRFGMVAPAILNTETGKLVVGHGRVTAAKQLMEEKAAPPARVRVADDGMWMVPVTHVAFRNADEARAYLIADNRMTELGGWDTDELFSELRYLDSIDASASMGWTEDELADLLHFTQQTTEGKPSITSEAETIRFLEAAIKQLYFYFSTEEYDQVVEMFETIADREKLENHSAVMIKLLQNYYASAGISLKNSGAADGVDAADHG